MSGQHARLAPSAAHRWIHCSGAPAFEAQFPDGPASVYAEEGTVLHEAGKYAVQRRLANSPLDFIHAINVSVNGKVHRLDTEQMGVVKAYVDFLEESGLFTGDCWVEQQFDLSVIFAGMFGTGDFINYDRETRTLTVVDLKGGKGVRVEAWETPPNPPHHDGELNPQLVCYAIGAVRLLEMLGDAVETVMGIIVQPRLNNVDSFSITRERLRAEEQRLRDAAVATEVAPKLVAGDWCRFCKASAHCPEQRKMALSMLEPIMDAPPTIAPRLSPVDMADILRRAPIIRDFLNQVEALAKTRLNAGQPVPGFKLVRGRANRHWSDPALLAQWIGFQETEIRRGCYTEPEPLSPAQMEKHCKATGVAFPASLVVSIESAPSLVPESDRRPAITGSTALLESQPG